jgi:molybdenum cofactor cytidylyltransferase
MLVHLVDHPYIEPNLVRAMLQRFADGQKLILVPRHRGKRGHPVIFSRALFTELLNAPMEQGAKAVVNAHPEETLELDTEDVGITLDIDTPELYRQHVKGE